MENSIWDSVVFDSSLVLKNRIVMAPLTRCFADSQGVPRPEVAGYYSRRADAGLIISEAINISEQAYGYKNTPGLFTKEQSQGWSEVTQHVHLKNGIIFAQLWHVGRVSHESLNGGRGPLAPSAVKLEGVIKREAPLRYSQPKAMSKKEILQTLSDYKKAAKLAMESGFDGVEIHGANGYLLEQFLRQETNKRNDEYGGCPSKRIQFVKHVVEGVCEEVGDENVGVRLSPAAHLFVNYSTGDEETYQALLEELNSFNLAYIHNGIFNDFERYDYLSGRSSEFLKKFSKHKVIGCGGYTAQMIEEEILQGKVDLVALGRAFIANSDLIFKMKNKIKPIDYETSFLDSLV